MTAVYGCEHWPQKKWKGDGWHEHLLSKNAHRTIQQPKIYEVDMVGFKQ